MNNGSHWFIPSHVPIPEPTRDSEKMFGQTSLVDHPSGATVKLASSNLHWIENKGRGGRYGNFTIERERGRMLYKQNQKIPGAAAPFRPPSV